MPADPLTPIYDPAPVEARWYAFWEEQGYFHADSSTVSDAHPPYTIVIPPPNITGSLHLGHALNITLQDILIRWHRMRGDAALWIPGTDHAGIATQHVVERQLEAEGTSREALLREGFIERVWTWRNKSGRTIINQLKQLGASCDWQRERFTLDDGLSLAVREVFVRLYQDGLIYRGERLINWCPRCRTALSDIEVEHEDVQGKMYHLTYPLADDPDTLLTVATTRPETMLGDTAVAVHPDDPRYNQLIGKTVSLPLTRRKIPIVGDSILVDRDFGTGVVKITPGHDFNDEKAGKRHELPTIALIDRDGTMSRLGLSLAQVHPVQEQALRGLSMAESRKRIVAWLKEEGKLLKVEDHRHAVGTCYRCKSIVEPCPSPQWFVKTNDPKYSLAAPAIAAVREGRIKLIPEGWANNYFGWMEQIQDWCISRQIWWGHRIPAWYCKNCLDNSVSGPLSDNDLRHSNNFSLEVTPIVQSDEPRVCPECGPQEFLQDPDVLDTWFSSSLWPFSTLGWPKKTDELHKFYPTSTLVTSFDILFFWVARMIMMGLYIMKEPPFRHVYIHALVRDAEGQKMSKSKGNVINPLEIMDRYGTDALRFTLASMASPGRDIRLTEERIAGYRNFANKLWNAARFIQLQLDEDDAVNEALPNVDQLLLPDRWIINRSATTRTMINTQLSVYRFDEAARHLYQFVWHDFCDWYLELIKPVLADRAHPSRRQTLAVLIHTFDQVLRLLHPFMPFITEELWHNLLHRDKSIMLAAYPVSSADTEDVTQVDREMDIIQMVITGIRGIRKTQFIPDNLKLNASLMVEERESIACLEANRSLIQSVAKLSGLHLSPQQPLHAATGTIVLPGGHTANIFVDLPQEMIESARARERARIEKRLEQLRTEIEKLEKKLSNESFVAKAPPDIVKKTREQRDERKAEQERLSSELNESV